MTRVFGSKPADCLAVIAPSIGPCCYEVDSRVIREIEKSFSCWRELIEETSPGKYRLNLWEANYRAFIDVGLRPENIFRSKLCTRCNNELFYSYRSENGCTGRMASLIMLS